MPPKTTAHSTARQTHAKQQTAPSPSCIPLSINKIWQNISTQVKPLNAKIRNAAADLRSATSNGVKILNKIHLGVPVAIKQCAGFSKTQEKEANTDKNQQKEIDEILQQADQTIANKISPRHHALIKLFNATPEVIGSKAANNIYRLIRLLPIATQASPATTQEIQKLNSLINEVAEHTSHPSSAQSLQKKDNLVANMHEQLSRLTGLLNADNQFSATHKNALTQYATIALNATNTCHKYIIRERYYQASIKNLYTSPRSRNSLLNDAADKIAKSIHRLSQSISTLERGSSKLLNTSNKFNALIDKNVSDYLNYHCIRFPDVQKALQKHIKDLANHLSTDKQINIKQREELGAYIRTALLDISHYEQTFKDDQNRHAEEQRRRRNTSRANGSTGSSRSSGTQGTHRTQGTARSNRPNASSSQPTRSHPAAASAQARGFGNHTFSHIIGYIKAEKISGEHLNTLFNLPIRDLKMSQISVQSSNLNLSGVVGNTGGRNIKLMFYDASTQTAHSFEYKRFEEALWASNQIANTKSIDLKHFADNNLKVIMKKFTPVAPQIEN